MSTSADKAYYIEHPPRATGSAGGTETKTSVLSVATGAAAVITSLWTMAAAMRPKGKVWVEFEAVTTPAYIRLRPDNTGGAGTTVANGKVIPAGTVYKVWLNPVGQDLFVDHISTGVGTLKWHVCSPEYDALVSTPA